MTTSLIVLGVLIVVAVAGLVWAGRRRRSHGGPFDAPSDDPHARLALQVDPTAEQDRLNPRPRAPEQTSQECWVPPGTAVTVGGFTIDGGMVYVGAGLYRDRLAWKPYDFLLDPTRRVDVHTPDHDGRTVSPWPAYAKLNPSARAALLAWLADGARAPNVHPGYVQLYLNGLLFRLGEDGPEEEAVAVRAEVQRLRDRYGHHPTLAHSFARAHDEARSEGGA